MKDPYDVERFVEAQEAGGTYSRAVTELRSGDKTSHWMWFVFPQVAGLGQSVTSRDLRSHHWRKRRHICALGARSPIDRMHRHRRETAGRTAAQIFGSIDALKLRSSMTLFLRAAPDEPLFQEVLDRFFDGQPDPATDRLL